MLMSNISPRSQAIYLEEAKLELHILKRYGGYWWLCLPVRRSLKTSKWHKYLICIFKFELGLWGKIHHTNFRCLKTRHLDKTNHLGSLYTKRETGTSRGNLVGLNTRQTGIGQHHPLSALWDEQKQDKGWPYLWAELAYSFRLLPSVPMHLQ